MRPVRWAANRLSEWWTRTCWGWLVIIGPILVYAALSTALDVVGLAADQDDFFPPVVDPDAFRSGLELDLRSIAGRTEFALTASLYGLVAFFSLVWALPRILGKTRNPFGGLMGVGIALGMAALLYVQYLASSYSLRVAFADEILIVGERLGALDPTPMMFNPLGLPIASETMLPSEMLARIHAVVYFLGNAAPWALIVLAATCAAYEPRTLGAERHARLRERMAVLQISVVLAAANIVLSVAYLRSMMAWPTGLLAPPLDVEFAEATTRYAAIWGAVGTLMLTATLAPAYVSLNRQFDRVARSELAAEGDDYVSYEDRMKFRARHGLLFSGPQAVATLGALIAPLLTSPTLDASETADRPRPAIEERIR